MTSLVHLACLRRAGKPIRQRQSLPMGVVTWKVSTSIAQGMIVIGRPVTERTNCAIACELTTRGHGTARVRSMAARSAGVPGR